MSAAPEPLTPQDCDLRKFDFMPLHVARLINSEYLATADAEAVRANLLMWCEAWHQVPAGSMPDDDMTLAKAAGFGPRDLAGFRALKDEIMRPWKLCADGRWYHPVVCEVANEQWERVTSKRRGWAERKKAQRDGSGVPEEVDGKSAKSPGTEKMSNGTTGDVTRDNPNVQAETPYKGERREERFPPGGTASGPPDPLSDDRLPTETVWTDGVRLLVLAGEREASARGFFGKLVKEHGLEAVAHGVRSAQQAGTGDPKPYIAAAAKSGPPPAPVAEVSDATWRDMLRTRDLQPGWWPEDAGAPPPALKTAPIPEACRVPREVLRAAGWTCGELPLRIAGEEIGPKANASLKSAPESRPKELGPKMDAGRLFRELDDAPAVAAE